MNSSIVRPIGHIDGRLELLNQAISSKEDFEYAATKLALLLMRKIDLRYFDVQKIAGKLHALDSAIAQSFVDAHSTLTCSSPGHERQSSERFRRHYLNRLIENGKV